MCVCVSIINKEVHSQPILVSLCQKSELNSAGGSLGTSIYIRDLKISLHQGP